MTGRGVQSPAWLIPDPDEFDLAPQCNVCGAEVPKDHEWVRVKRVDRARRDLSPKALKRNRAKLKTGDTFVNRLPRDPKRPVVCLSCSKKGWRGKWCLCGAVMHKRDYAGGACGKCRAEIYERRRADAA